MGVLYISIQGQQLFAKQWNVSWRTFATLKTWKPHQAALMTSPVEIKGNWREGWCSSLVQSGNTALYCVTRSPSWCLCSGLNSQLHLHHFTAVQARPRTKTKCKDMLQLTRLPQRQTRLTQIQPHSNCPSGSGCGAHLGSWSCGLTCPCPQELASQIAAQKWLGWDLP